VHLGLGAFHRAHQAVYTEDAIAEGGGDWGICGVAPRSRGVPDALARQDGLYTVLTKGPDDHDLRVVGSLRGWLHAPSQPEQVLARLADPATHVLSLTVTEKGYRYQPATGQLRTDDPDLQTDLSGAWPPRTILGWIAWGLEARRRADAGPVTVLCCDNLPDNGPTLRTLVLQYCARLPSVLGSPLTAWVATNFSAGRPAWEAAGATLTGDVRPYETAKLRLLNGAHSALAYLGAAAGYERVSEAVADAALARMLQRLMDEDVTPTLRPPADLDLDAYKARVLERFANPALGHRTTQIAMDGSQKLPQRLLDTARDRLAAHAVPHWVCLAVAGWMRYLSGPADNGRPLPVDDPLGDRLRRLAAIEGPAQRVDALLAVSEVFGTYLPASPAFRQHVVDHLERLLRKGVVAAVADAVSDR